MLAVGATIGAALFVLPIQTWLDQDDDLAQRQAELDELEKVNGQLAGEVDRLQTDDGIREAAREEIGFVDAGEGAPRSCRCRRFRPNCPTGGRTTSSPASSLLATAGPAPAAAD